MKIKVTRNQLKNNYYDVYNPYKILKTFIVGSRSELGIKNADINFIKASELPISDRYSTGKELTKHQLTDAFLVANLEKGTKEQVELLEPAEVEVEEMSQTSLMDGEVVLHRLLRFRWIVVCP